MERIVKEYREKLRHRLSSKRYEHSLGVANMAARLAGVNGGDIEAAFLCGLLHDYAKELDKTELLQIAMDHDLITDHVEVLQPGLLHGAVSAFLLQQEGVPLTPEMVKAISFHTTGHPEMDLLTKIIYVADYIEPNRHFPGVEELRLITHQKLDAGVVGALDQTIVHVMQQGGFIHPYSILARNGMLEGALLKKLGN